MEAGGKGAMTEEELAFGWAFSAQCWAARPSRRRGAPNFDELARRVAAASREGAADPASLLGEMGASPMFWPALSRWLVMADPACVRAVAPPRCPPLDADRGRAWMRSAYRRIGNAQPKASSWLHALADAAGREGKENER